MLSTRRRIGPPYEKAPYEKVNEAVIQNLAKIIFSAIASVVWLFVLYLIINMVNFLGTEVTQSIDTGISAMDMHKHPYCFPVKVIGVILLVLYIFRDKLKER